jgi:Putative restriction endonuclease
MYFRDPNPEWEKSATYIDQIPDLAVEIVSPSNLGKKWEDNLTFYRQLAFPEFWLVHLDGSIEIWRSAEPKTNAVCKAGGLFFSPLFPGLAIDPAWLLDYPNEIKRIDQFSPEVIVSPSVVNPNLTRKAEVLAGRIAQHFGKTYHPAGLQSEIGREAARRQGTAQEPRAGENRIRGASRNGKTGPASNGSTGWPYGC